MNAQSGLVWIMIGMFAAAFSSEVLAQLPRADSAAKQSDASPTETQKYESAVSLTDALDRATAAIRLAEKGGDNSRKKLAEAEFYAQQAVEFDPASAKADFIFARMNHLVGHTRDAFSQVRRYVSPENPEGAADWEGFKVLGDLYFEATYYVQALSKYRRAVDLNPSEPSILIAMSRCALKMAKRKEALVYAKEGVRLDPSSAEAFQVLSEVLVATGELDEAKQAVHAAIDRTRAGLRDQPASMKELNRLQRLHLALQEVIRGQLNKESANPAYYLEYADSAMESGEVSLHMHMIGIQQMLEKGISAGEPASSAALIERYAEYSANVMMHKKAIEVLEKYLESHPEDAAATAAIESLQAGKLTDDKSATASAGGSITP